MNILICLVCWYFTWQFWRVKGRLIQFNKNLLSLIENTPDILNQSSEFLIERQKKTAEIRSQYNKLASRWENLQLILFVVGWGINWQSVRQVGFKKKSI
ncbi:MAG: hypothetical protein ACRC2J_09310 [Microcoleaceae cyanobacterium]